MFSIFHGLFTGVALIVNGLNKNIDDSKNYKEAKDKGNILYHSSDGYRLTDNKRLVHTTYKNGHKYIKDMYNNTIYYDITKNQNEKSANNYRQLAKDNGDDFYIFPNNKVFAKGTKLLSTNYFDVETNEPIIHKNINNIIFNVSLNTGKIIRMSCIMDKTKEIQGYIMPTTYLNNYDDMIFPNTIDEIINVFNKRQDELLYNSSYNDGVWMKDIYYICPSYNNNKTIGQTNDKCYIDVRGYVVCYNYNNEQQAKRNEGL